MLVEIRTSSAAATVETKGAELQSLSDVLGTEYLWDGQKEFWNRRSPTLFPVIGVVKEQTATIDGVDYPMPKHGIVRDVEFTVEAQTEDSVTLVYQACEDSLRHYPFAFALHITYSLKGAELTVGWRVDNLGDKAMPFQIGGHPAFRVPMGENEQFEDYELRFDCKEDFISLRLDGEGLLRSDVLTVARNTDTIPLRHALFDDDALMFRGLQSSAVSLQSKKTGRGVRVTFGGFPYLGIWSPSARPAPFVCSEPWYGINSKQTDTTDFLAKEGMQSLAVGERFFARYKIALL